MLERVIESRRRDLGGFEVARVLPAAERRMVGPFIFLDHMGPADFPPGHGADVRPHPHIGLSTVTYLFDGEIFHRDSLGSAQSIRPGEVNWMTAGRGITHSERTDTAARARGQRMHGIQSWVALPDAAEEEAPSFANHAANALPVFTDRGVWARLIAGAALGLRSPVRTHSPLFYLHVEIARGVPFALPADYPERAAYIVDGAISHDGRTYDSGRMLVFAAGAAPVVTAEQAARLIVLGGEALGQRYIWWNFVSSRRERLRGAAADWKAGRFPLPPDDNREFIPAPDAPPLP